MDVVLKLRIALDNGSILFGPGSEELFTLISETGSVSQAARKMGLSLSKAWKIVKDTEEVYGSPLVICSFRGDSSMYMLSTPLASATLCLPS